LEKAAGAIVTVFLSGKKRLFSFRMSPNDSEALIWWKNKIEINGFPFFLGLLSTPLCTCNLCPCQKDIFNC